MMVFSAKKLFLDRKITSLEFNIFRHQSNTQLCCLAGHCYQIARASDSLAVWGGDSTLRILDLLNLDHKHHVQEIPLKQIQSQQKNSNEKGGKGSGKGNSSNSNSIPRITTICGAKVFVDVNVVNSNTNNNSNGSGTAAAETLLDLQLQEQTNSGVLEEDVDECWAFGLQSGEIGTICRPAKGPAFATILNTFGDETNANSSSTSTNSSKGGGAGGEIVSIAYIQRRIETGSTTKSEDSTELSRPGQQRKAGANSKKDKETKQLLIEGIIASVDKNKGNTVIRRVIGNKMYDRKDIFHGLRVLNIDSI